MAAWDLQPILDSDNLADQLQVTLNIRRDDARRMAYETLDAITIGRYETSDGTVVAWSDQVAEARASRVSIPPEVPLPDASTTDQATLVTIGNVTTLDAARRMVDAGARPLALNFANGATPGGGWLNGALAQEESLCRCSALYATIQDDPMYQAHRLRGDRESSHWAILSPDVPVHRDDTGALLDQPWLCSFITMAAPVASRVGQPRSRQLMAERVVRLLQIAAAHGYRELVLGAWGCGAFGNDVDATAHEFASALDGPFSGTFSEVTFAIADWSPEREILGPFARRFGAVPVRPQGRDTPRRASPRGRAMRFNTPPGWPQPPPGWKPRPGWTPDPSWPAIPPGWQLWVAAEPDNGADSFSTQHEVSDYRLGRDLRPELDKASKQLARAVRKMMSVAADSRERGGLEGDDVEGAIGDALSLLATLARDDGLTTLDHSLTEISDRISKGLHMRRLLGEFD